MHVTLIADVGSPSFPEACDPRKKHWQGLWFRMDLSLLESKPLLSPPPDDWTDSDTRCDGGWLPNKGFCYLLANESGSWDAARLKCKALGADLTSIHSLADVELVVTKLHSGGEFVLNLLFQVFKAFQVSLLSTTVGVPGFQPAQQEGHMQGHFRKWTCPRPRLIQCCSYHMAFELLRGS